MVALLKLALARRLRHPERSFSPTNLVAAPTNNQQLKTKNCSSGFTLLELMIVLAIIAILATLAVPMYTANIKRAKEAVLRTDLKTMRDAIESFTYDKQKAPQTLDDLVQAGYIKAVPKDPMTDRTDTWVPAQGDMYTTTDETQSGGIDDIHSGSQAIATDGTLYSTW